MKNCDSCVNFIKIRTWHDGRKGICDYTDYNIIGMKGKPCPFYRPKKYGKQERRNNKVSL